MNAWLWLLLSLFLTFSPPRVVTVTDFHAEGRSGSIEVFWETATETDNAGFNLYRDTSETGSFSLDLGFIPSTVPPGSVVGASYQYTDSNVEPGVTYYYKLKAVDLSGQPQWHDVIASASAAPADTATPTPMATATWPPTATHTPTATGGPLATSTPTGTPTTTPAPTGTPTPTEMPTPLPSATGLPPTSAPTLPPSVTASPTRIPTQPPSPTLSPDVTQSPSGPTATASPSPAPTATPEPSPTPTPTPFPTVPPSQPSPSSNLCVQALSYGWLIAGAAVLLALVVAFAVLMARGQGPGEP